MKLGDYLQTEGITAAEFGRRIGASRSTVLRWVKGARSPDSTSMRRVIDATSGAVSANDFFHAPDQGEAA